MGKKRDSRHLPQVECVRYDCGEHFIVYCDLVILSPLSFCQVGRNTFVNGVNAVLLLHAGNKRISVASQSVSGESATDDAYYTTYYTLQSNLQNTYSYYTLHSHSCLLQIDLFTLASHMLFPICIYHSLEKWHTNHTIFLTII